MTGLKDGFMLLPRVRIRTHTTSSTGAPRTDSFDAIPLCDALAVPAKERVIVRAQDGLVLAFSAQDAQNAVLAPLSDGGWQLVFAQDATRQRWVRQPLAFEVQ